MEDFDWKFVGQIIWVTFAAGVIYGNLKSFKKDFDDHRIESLTWRAKLEKTLFGDDGRNGLVGDNIIHGEHIKACKSYMERAHRHD
jgi:hypothetical protein